MTEPTDIPSDAALTRPLVGIAGPGENNIGSVQMILDPDWQKKIFDRSDIIGRLKRIGEDMVQEASAIVPKGPSGNLETSIYSRVIQGRNEKGQFGDAVLEFGADIDYALPVEFGHHTTAGTFVEARPFMRPVALKPRSFQ